MQTGAAPRYREAGRNLRGEFSSTASRSAAATVAVWVHGRDDEGRQRRQSAADRKLCQGDSKNVRVEGYGCSVDRSGQSVGASVATVPPEAKTIRDRLAAFPSDGWMTPSKLGTLQPFRDRARVHLPDFGGLRKDCKPDHRIQRQLADEMNGANPFAEILREAVHRDRVFPRHGRRFYRGESDHRHVCCVVIERYGT